MESIKKFEKFKLDTSATTKITGGEYQKTGCGTLKGPGYTMTYKCDLIDDKGIKTPRYYDTVIRPA
jgi:hypothetical protein